jgi:hypothetical protein
MLSYEIEINAESLEHLLGVLRGLDRAWPALREEKLRQIGENFVVLERGIINQELEHTGALANSVGYMVQDNTVTIGPNVPSPTIDPGKVLGVHEGAKARWVPLDNLINWVPKIGGDINTAIFIQRRIAGHVPGREGGTSEWQRQRRGTPGFPFSQETLNSGEAGDELREATRELAEGVIKLLYLG